MKIALTAAELFTPIASIYRPVLVTEDGVITAMGPRERTAIPPAAQQIDLGDSVIAPGFLDIHIHGAAGHDVMEADGEALSHVEAFLVKHGVTSYLPTTVTASMASTLAALERLGAAVKSGRERKQAARARPVGIHLEGPFISTRKCGVHPVAEIIPPSVDVFEKMWSASGETIRMVTVAPELPGGESFIRSVESRGVRCSLGHSDAGTAAAKSAVAAGARHATHTFNAMRALDHRDPGILGVVLSENRMSADIIADGVHVSPEVLKLFLAVKGEERAVLITDGISATGMPDGVYMLGNFEVQVKGNVCLANGKLAGSVLTMDLAIRNVISLAQWRLQQAVRLATLNPARAIGMDFEVGMLGVGRRADITILSKTGEVRRTMIAGVWKD